MTPGAEDNELETASDMGAMEFRAFLGPVAPGAVQPDTAPVTRQLPTVHKAGLANLEKPEADQTVKEFNASVMARWGQLVEQFAGSDINITEDKSFRKLIVDGLIDKNASFVLGINTDSSRIPGTDAMKNKLLADGIDGFLAGSRAVQDAIAHGLDLTKDD